jgi:hypothetical protein
MGWMKVSDENCCLEVLLTKLQTDSEVRERSVV